MKFSYPKYTVWLWLVFFYGLSLAMILVANYWDAQPIAFPLLLKFLLIFAATMTISRFVVYIFLAMFYQPISGKMESGIINKPYKPLVSVIVPA